MPKDNTGGIVVVDESENVLHYGIPLSAQVEPRPITSFEIISESMC